MKAKEILYLIATRNKRNRARKFHLEMAKKFYREWPEIKKMKAENMAKLVSMYGKSAITPEMEKEWKKVFNNKKLAKVLKLTFQNK